MTRLSGQGQGVRQAAEGPAGADGSLGEPDIYLRYEEAVARFQTGSLEDGWHVDSTGLPFYFIRNPGLGLWATSKRFGE